MKIYVSFILIIFSTSLFADVCSDFRPLEKESYQKLKDKIGIKNTPTIGQKLLLKEIELAQTNEEMIEANVIQVCKYGTDSYSFIKEARRINEGTSTPDDLDYLRDIKNQQLYQELKLNSYRIVNAKSCGLLTKEEKKAYKAIRKRSSKIIALFKDLINERVQNLSELDKKTFLILQDNYYSLSQEVRLKPLNYNLKKKLLNTLVIIGNLTWGLPNTVIGGLYTMGVLVTPLLTKDNKTVLERSQNGKQFAVKSVYGMGCVSMGLFDICTGEDTVDAHEGGHSVQSAVLGPLYFPTVLLTYAISGDIQDNKIEDSADKLGAILPARAFKKKECKGKSEAELMKILERE